MRLIESGCQDVAIRPGGAPPAPPALRQPSRHRRSRFSAVTHASDPLSDQAARRSPDAAHPGATIKDQTAARGRPAGGPRSDQPASNGTAAGSRTTSVERSATGRRRRLGICRARHRTTSRRTHHAPCNEAASRNPRHSAAGIDDHPPGPNTCASSTGCPNATRLLNTSPQQKIATNADEHSNHKPTSTTDQRGRKARLTKPRLISRSIKQTPIASRATIHGPLECSSARAIHRSPAPTLPSEASRYRSSYAANAAGITRAMPRSAFLRSGRLTGSRRPCSS